MIDGGLSAEFKRRLEPQGWHLQRVETGGTGRGIPDTSWAAPGGVEGWVEFKVTDGWAVGLRPEQIGWLQRRGRMGCRVWVAVRQRCEAGKGTRARRERRDGLWLVPGVWAAALAQGGLRWAEGSVSCGVRHWSGPGPARWNWDEIRETLVSYFSSPD